MRTKLLLGCATGLLVALTRAQAATHYVDAASTNSVPPFSNWTTAAATIQDAVDSAAEGDEIVVTNGVYETGARAVNGMSNRVAVIKPVIVRSVNGPAYTSIVGHGPNGDNAIRCVYLTNGALLTGFTLTNGATQNSGNITPTRCGGGIWCEGTNAIVSNCVLTGNSGNYGGGAAGGTLNNCIVTGNSAYNGGGAYASTLTNCTLTGNSADYGGGAAWSTLSDSALSGNSAQSGGGGAYTSTLNNCMVTDNIAYYSSGAAWSTLNNCRVTGNSAWEGYGGGVGDSTLNNCTLTGNSASAEAGGGACYSTLNNCIVYSNSSLLDGDNYAISTLNYSCTTPAPESGVGNITNAPLFLDTNGWSNLRLQSNSPCINAGNNAYVTISTDLDGRPRVVGGSVDIGAYEWQGAIRYVSAASTNPIAPYSSWEFAAVTIQDAVDAAAPGDEIVVTDGVYQTGARAVYGMSNRVAVTKPVTVRSVNGPAYTSIVGHGPIGENAIRCVYLTNGAVLAGFTLTNGATQFNEDLSPDYYGGGVWCEGLSAVLSNCVLTQCSSDSFGGGAYSGTLNNCLLMGNSASEGGGGGAYGSTLNNCTLTGNWADPGTGGGAEASTLNNCALSNNRANGGGGAHASMLNDCTLTDNIATSAWSDFSRGGGAAASTLTNCTLSGNSAAGHGGGVYSSTLADCVITGNVAGAGGGASESTLTNCMIMGNRAFEFSGGGTWNSALNNCTLSGNSAEVGGGAHYGTLTNCVVTGNSAWDRGGGADYATLYSCTLIGNSAESAGGGAYGSILINCTLTSNMASNSPWTSSTDGGGAFDCTLSNCMLVANWADWGGGASESTLNDCMVTGNVARQDGGGALWSTLNNCTLTNNSAWDRGAGATGSTLNNCMVVGNSASEFGGGAYASFVNNSALVGNTARYGGGAFGGTLSGSILTGNFAWDNEGGGGGTYNGTLTNCIVFYNSAAGIGDNYAACTLNYSCTTPAPASGIGNIINAPLFVDTNGWSNLRLQSNSPCINAGHNAAVATSTDLDGRPRIVGGVVDMGAYEYQGPGTGEFFGWLQQSGLPTDGSADYVDTDHDRHNNWQEWIAGTDPTNSLSMLWLASPVITPTNVILTWTSVTNRTYTLEQATNLGGAPAFSVLRSNLVGLPDTTSWTDTNAPVASRRFYRLQVSP